MKREEVIYCLKAQSERYSEVCEECPLYGQTGVDHCCEDALQMAITALQNQPVWIPVSERLPEDCVPVNVTWINRNPDPYYKDIRMFHLQILLFIAMGNGTGGQVFALIISKNTENIALIWLTRVLIL